MVTQQPVSGTTSTPSTPTHLGGDSTSPPLTPTYGSLPPGTVGDSGLDPNGSYNTNVGPGSTVGDGYKAQQLALQLQQNGPPGGGGLDYGTTLLDQLNATFPWLRQLGIPIQFFRDLAADVVTEGEVLEKVRQTEQWQFMFAGIRRPDGTMRHNEATHLARQDDYRTLLKQNGRADYEYDNPQDFVAFFENDIAPQELAQRFQVYKQVEEGAQDVKDAFYVYAGMQITTDDLYQAAISPEARQRLNESYNQAIAAQPLDYQTWITRATEAGLSRVAESFENLRSQGALTGTAITRALTVDPDFARQMMDVLYTGGGPETTTLSLEELMSSFELAMIGSAAANSGVGMPSKERVQAIRQAGVDRAAALKGYAEYGRQKNLLAGAAQRAGKGFTQDDFEKAVFLQQADAQQLLGGIMAQEEAMGAQQGAVNFDQTRTGGFAQRGLRGPSMA
jgi:hypothetical protein